MEKELERLPRDIRDRIITRLTLIAHNPRPGGCKKLRGREAYRLRVGDYRVLYTVDDDGRTVVIVSVGHRREIYR